MCRQPSTLRGLIALVQFNPNANHFTSATAMEEIPASQTPDMKHATTVSLPIYPHSGANICLAGPKQLAQLGLTQHQLRPCTKRVTAVGGSILTCTGWLPVKFEIEKQATVQPLFFCTKVDVYTSANRAALNSISYLCSFPDQCPHLLPPRYQQSSSVIHLDHPDQHNCCIGSHQRMFPNWRPTIVNSLQVAPSTIHHHFHPYLACLPKSI